MKVESAVTAAAYAIAMAALARTELSDLQAMVIAGASGAIGGFCWSMIMRAKEPAKWSEIFARIIACAIIAPAIVLGIMTALAGDGDVTYFVGPVFASAGFAGLVSWPAAAMCMKLRPDDIREFIARLLTRSNPPQRGDDRER